MPAPFFACPGCQRVGRWAGPVCHACTRLAREARDPITTPPSSPAWRPRHYPPACPVCNGFGYVASANRDRWSACRQCRNHPGHSCSHEEWNLSDA